MTARLAVCVLTVVAALLCSCDSAVSMLPKSGGRPYEVLVVASDRANAHLLDSMLSQDAAGLPQAEPMFDVSLTDSLHFNQTAKLARNIVIVTVNPDVFTSVRVRYEKNVWAKPQMVAYVNAPSGTALTKSLPQIGRQLADLFTRAEMNAEIARLAESGNVGASVTVDSMFGCAMKIPADMKYSKKADGFLWLSDNAPSGMQNICMYSYPGDRLDSAMALAARDSVMKCNIPGERQGMYMQTVRGSVDFVKANEKGRILMISRGLWEMHGDAMGGPFVAHSAVDSARGRIIVAEAFVYAPEMKKRNLMRQVEAALYTLKIKN